MKKKVLLLGCLLSLFAAGYSQTDCKSFVRMGLGTGATENTGSGISFMGEYGLDYRGWEISGSFSYYDAMPLKNEVRSLEYDSNNGVHAATLSKDVDNKRSVSLMLNVGYDLLRLFDFNARHHFCPYVAMGWSECTRMVNHGDGIMGIEPNGQIVRERNILLYDNSSDVNFAFGVNYSYDINSKWSVGLHYEYQNLMERDIVGLSIKRSF